MSSSPQVSIILVNWNGVQDTLECLESLSHVQYDNFAVVVVDNGSVGDDVTQITAANPNVTVLKTGRNLGFTGGNNVGIQHALENGADYILCLNTDTVVAPDFLAPMVEALEADVHSGIATSTVYMSGWATSLGCWVRLDQFPAVGHIVVSKRERDDSPRALEVSFAEGCALMMKRSVAEATQGFDEDFFAYIEDADLCLRARAKGWKSIAVPSSHVWHKIGGSSGGLGSPTAMYYCLRNSWTLVRRHGSLSDVRAFRKAVLVFLLPEWVWFFKQPIVLSREQCDPKLKEKLLNNMLGAMCGFLGCGGPRSRWRVLEYFLRQFLLLIMATGTLGGRLLRPVYCLRRRRTKAVQ